MFSMIKSLSGGGGGGKNAQKIYPEMKDTKQTKTKYTFSTNTSVKETNRNMPNYVLGQNNTNRLTDTTIVNIDSISSSINEFDPCHQIYIRCKDPSAYDALRNR